MIFGYEISFLTTLYSVFQLTQNDTKNVLIPLDFSDISLNTVEYAEDFFKNTAVNFDLLR
jgi:hypothetical protein